MFETPDLAVVAFPLATLVLALVAFRELMNSERRRSRLYIFLFVVPVLLVIFGLVVASIFFLARIAGFSASFKLLANVIDISGAWFLLAFVGYTVVFPLLYALINCWWKISRCTSLREFTTLANTLAIILFLTIACAGVAIIRSQLLSGLLFGTSNALDCVEKLADETLSLDMADLPCSTRFSVFLRRVSSALGISSTPGFTVIGLLITIAAILEGIDAFLNLYDRFSGKKNRPPVDQEKPTPLPPVQPPNHFPEE